MAGLHKSPFKGFSVEFAEHRQYGPGDEIRHIDWRAYGKTDRYYVKEYEEETNLKAHLVVDSSGSMSYSGRTIAKFEYARRLAAALAYLAISQRDAVGLVTFDTALRAMIPPRSAPNQFSIVCQALERTHPGGETPLSGILHTLAERIRRRGLVIVLSDGFDQIDTLSSALQHLRHRHHEVLFFHILAPEEEEFPIPPRSAVPQPRTARPGPAGRSPGAARRVSRSIPELLPELEGANPGDGCRLSSGARLRSRSSERCSITWRRGRVAGGEAESVAVSGGVLNALMLLGLLGVALPLLIHLFNRRRDQVIDWGAMQFLDLGRRAQRKIRLTELLLMLARMAISGPGGTALAGLPLGARAGLRLSPRRPAAGRWAGAATRRPAMLCWLSTVPTVWRGDVAGPLRAPSPSAGPDGSSRNYARATRWPSSSPARGSAL